MSGLGHVKLMTILELLWLTSTFMSSLGHAKPRSCQAYVMPSLGHAKPRSC
ncbi:hypothetical protein HYC85_030280 [Camellia sinensis]|uniref:Uncharacterized protein n=1 Tax=Camellia sinensis TaxID=4442 RepID=A0A7J7G0G0_CAMSI|nr:hypothetical protein HYC85_030280 [Camellia sinensis]